MSTDSKINKRLEENIYFALGIPLSIFCSCLCSFFGMMFFVVRTMDLHKNTSGPGDFAPAAASVIRNDILVNWAITLPLLTIIAIWEFFMIRGVANLLSSRTNHRFLPQLLYGVFILNVIILYAGVLFAGISYWYQRAPHF